MCRMKLRPLSGTDERKTWIDDDSNRPAQPSEEPAGNHGQNERSLEHERFLEASKYGNDSSEDGDVFRRKLKRRH